MKEQNHYDVMKKTILASMILAPLVPFISVLFIGYYYFTSALEGNTIASLKRIVDDHRLMIDSFLGERKANLEFIIQSHTFEELSQPDVLKVMFDLLQKESGAFIDLGVFNQDGVHVTYQGPYKLTGKIYKDADWFIEVMKKGYYISDVFLGFRKVPHFVIAIAREDQGRKWILRSTIDTYMFNNLVEKVRIGKTGEAYIVNSDGIFQTDRRSGGNLMNEDPHYKTYPEHHTGINTFIKGDYLYATTWIKDNRWLMVVRQEKADAFKELHAAASLIVLISILGGAIIVGLAFYLTNMIINRMEQADRDKDKMGQQLIRATRLAELGEMAAGFAHEINNPLQIIKSEQSLIEMLFKDLKDKGELKESEELKDIEDSTAQIRLQIERCAKITQAILKFGRQSEPVYQDVDVRHFIPEILDMIAKKASVNGIEIKKEISENTPSIHGDPGQLQQVLLNLFNNAMYAISEKHGVKGGRLVIRAGLNSEQKKVEIAVTDNGSGISPDNQKKIFSPFFTTKPVGKGTGLGLSVCYGIINSMGGGMEVSSEPGFGTTFTIKLPVV